MNINLLFNNNSVEVGLRELSPLMLTQCAQVESDYRKELNEKVSEAIENYGNYLDMNEALLFADLIEKIPADLVGLTAEEVKEKAAKGEMNNGALNFTKQLTPLFQKITAKLEALNKYKFYSELGKVLINKTDLEPKLIAAINTNYNPDNPENFWANQSCKELTKINDFFRSE